MSFSLPVNSSCQSCPSRMLSGPGGNVLNSVAGGPASGAGGGEPVTHVLSTLESDGSRRWLRPRLSKGGWWQKRRIVAYLLMVVFVAIPHLRIGGKPFILLDVVARQFTVLGRTFYPTDSILLALLLLSVFISIVLLTAIAGRAWCGWACPQTVYMEFMFRPLDRFFDGTVGKGGLPARGRHWGWQIAKFATYLLLCMFLAHTFLAYFVGTEKLADWIRSSPIQHPVAFLVMAATTGMMMFDFLFFREQMCVIACPYGRFQSVMLDEQSLIVAYDDVRGEPRRKGKRQAAIHCKDESVDGLADGSHDADRSDLADGLAHGVMPNGDSVGDCVDCNQCVVVCPTGIDIRDGLQMECINCTQCIDACDSVMDKVNLPRGLIRYSSQDAIARKPRKMVRARTIVYPVILSVVLGGFAYAIGTKSGFDARILRGKGNPFTIQRGGLVSNSFHLRLVNRTNEPRTYQLQVVTPQQATLEVIDSETTTLDPGDSKLVPFSIHFPTRVTFGDGNEVAELRIDDGGENQRTLDFRLLGPRT